MNFNQIKWADTFLQNFQSGREFYAELFAWQFTDQYDDEQLVYSLANLSTQNGSSSPAIVAGIGPCNFPKPDDMPLNWGVYIVVQELEASIDKVLAAGGKVCKEPMEVMDAGRMAVCLDSRGAVFHLWQALTHFGTEIEGVPGALCWFELVSRDVYQSMKFYHDVFGWDAVEQQTNGKSHWRFKVDNNVIGGMHTRTDESRDQELWVPYFNTVELNRQLDDCSRLGGSVVFGPVSEREIGRYAVLSDLENNLFGLAEYV